jgi:hypothetical protein
MRIPKRFVGTTGFSIAAAALLMGAGTASADGPSANDIVICGDGCVVQGGPSTAFAKITIVAFKVQDGSPVAQKLGSVLQKLQIVMDKP